MGLLCMIVSMTVVVTVISLVLVASSFSPDLSVRSSLISAIAVVAVVVGRRVCVSWSLAASYLTSLGSASSMASIRTPV